jgi:hypothetical protein
MAILAQRYFLIGFYQEPDSVKFKTGEKYKY